jgi:hypothetical protein
MTRACCPSCRVRFSRDTAPNLLTCPLCGGALQQVLAEQALGLRLMNDAKLGDQADAVARALSAIAPDWDGS